ncbi:MAG TPA: error-prone DNA polymerase [Thermomicrobiaceae bacterium]|nr:error-prone DNA polymerase [Thermomicrobiaceae bacterium]
MAGRYVELHCHTAYSFLDGASLPDEMMAQAERLGYQALAVTDHDGLYGAMEFARSARERGLRAIIGAELTLTDASHLTLLVRSPDGYANLCRLITQAHMDYAQPDRGPSLPLEAIEERSDGLILLTGCREGRLARLADEGRLDEARRLLDRYRACWGVENVFVELQNHLVQGDVRRIRRLVQLAGESGLGYVATGDVHYHLQQLHRLQDVLVAIKHRTTLDASHRLRRPNAEFFLQSPEAMALRFAELPEALANTVRIAERCTGFDLTNPEHLGYHFPEVDRADETLRRETEQRLAERYGDNPEAQRRLDEELRLVHKHGLAGFFLIYRDIMELARQVAAEIRGTGPRSLSDLPPGRGRGSSVSSIICYLLGLSHIDPIKYNLFVGRFLNEELGSVPDIDLDFPRDIREKLIERIYQRYGNDHAALVCAFPTYRARSAIRDIGKALGLPEAGLDRLAKLSEHVSANKLATEMERLPEFRARQDAPLWRDLVTLARQIAGLPRHVSQHVGGIVISSRPLCESVPIQPAAMEGRFLCQWDKDSIDDARMIKIDFLALGMLSLVEECLELIVQSGHPPVDLSRIDFGDAAVYDMISDGDTLGTFQIESRAQIQTIVRTQPRRLEDLIVQVAIVRPGPITGGALNPYIRQRQRQRRYPGRTIKPAYDHPVLAPILKETAGAILYQEQVLQVAMAMGGFSAGKAESFRRAMSRKRSREAMEGLREEFLAGAAAQGINATIAERVFDKLLGFAAYGFPKSHAAAFAVLAYQSAWLKHYYPAGFVCALLNNQPMGFYSPNVIVNDAQRHGVPVLPPDVNFSDGDCTVESGGRCISQRKARSIIPHPAATRLPLSHTGARGSIAQRDPPLPLWERGKGGEGNNGRPPPKVRLGLRFVGGVGEEPAMAIEAERRRGGRYRSLRDLIQRTRPRREVLEKLILVGACRGFGLHRRELLWQLGLIIPDRRLGKVKEPAGWQLALELPTGQDMVELPLMDEWESLHADYDLMKLSPHDHPLRLLRPILPAGIVQAGRLSSQRNYSVLRIAGMVVCRQRPMTANGTLFLLLEDETGLANVIVHPRLYEQRRVVARGSPFVIVTGRLQLQDGTVNVVASEIEALDASRPTPPISPAVQLLLEEAAAISSLPEDPEDGLFPQLELVVPPAHDFR